MAGFVNPFKKIFPSYLGVDIGTTSIKAVEVKPGKRLPEIVNYAFIEASDYLGRANSALQTSSLKLFEQDVASLLQAMLQKMKPRTTDAIASIPVFSAFLTVLDFPEMNDADLKKAITFQARQYIPLPISDVAIEWIKVGEYEDARGIKHQQVLLISVPQEQIKRYQNIFELAGLKLQALEVESLSLARVLIGADPTPTIIVDIGSRSTTIAFVEKSVLRFTNQSDFGGASLTQALATGLNINPLRAEDLKKERGILGGGADYELSTIMLPFLDVIIQDVKKAHFNYTNQFPAASKMERMVLAGGGANLLGIEKYFAREFEIPVVKANSFMRFEYPQALEPLLNELNPLLDVSLGLTLREFL